MVSAGTSHSPPESGVSKKDPVFGQSRS